MEYIHSNPVRRGLVDEPDEWYWSSARDWLSGTSSPIRIDKESLSV